MSSLVSCTGCLVGSLLIIVFWSLFDKSKRTNSTLGVLAVVSMFLYVIGYAWVMNAFGYTYPPEILPVQIRATGMALGFGLKMATTIALVQVTPLAIQRVSWRYFLVFVISIALFLVGFWFWFPETSGIPLEEVARVFGDEVSFQAACF